MSNYVSPNQPNYGNGETSKIPPIKPYHPPRDDSFRKTFKDRKASPTTPPTQKEEEEFAVEEKDDSKPTLFELSKNTRKTKTSSSQSALQDQSSELSSKKPLSAKEEEGSESYSFEEEGDANVSQRTIKEQPPPKAKMPSSESESLIAKKEFATPENELNQEFELPLAEKDETSLEEAPPKKELAPFDPSKKPESKQETLELGRQQATMMQQSVERPKKTGGTFETKESGFVSKKDKTKGEGRVSTSDGQEKSNVAAVNPSIQSLGFQTESMQDVQDMPQAATIKDLANQIIERIQIMRRDDQTSTIVTLRHPPILEGATLTLTTSDNAKREFNISFANLSPNAKVFLDQKLTEQSLTEVLERKGIVVHMIRTTTQAETILTPEAGQAQGESKGQQQQRQGQGQERQAPEEEEEGVT